MFSVFCLFMKFFFLEESQNEIVSRGQLITNPIRKGLTVKAVVADRMDPIYY